MVMITTMRVKMNLLKFLKENENTRKIFGEREIKIIEKQLLGISLTQSEKNRLSRDIRKKLRFIAEISGFKEQFELKKGAEIKKLIEGAREIILNDILSKDIKKIMLFGSALENQLTPRSDIDIAIEFNNINLREATLFRKRIMGEANEKMDIQVYNYLPAKLKKKIGVKGKILYKNES